MVARRRLPTATTITTWTTKMASALSRIWSPDRQATIEVIVQNGSQPPGVLQGWMDFDGDGSWNTPGEQVFRDLAVSAGTNLLTINVPSVGAIGRDLRPFPLWLRTRHFVPRPRRGRRSGRLPRGNHQRRPDGRRRQLRRPSQFDRQSVECADQRHVAARFEHRH